MSWKEGGCPLATTSVSLRTVSLMLLSYPQRFGHCHGAESPVHHPATVPGRHYGLGDDCHGDPGTWLWCVFPFLLGSSLLKVCNMPMSFALVSNVI